MTRGVDSPTGKRRRGGSRAPLGAATVALALMAGGAGIATGAPVPTGSPTVAPTPAAAGHLPAAGGRETSFDRLDARPVDPTAPPLTGEYLGFLGTIDLPRIEGVGGPWVGTEPADARQNPSATPCDATRFSVAGVRQEQVRTFVVPAARRLPTTFGLSETLGRFPSPRSARLFADRIASRLAGCERRVSSATVTPLGPVRFAELSGATWTLEFELPDRRVLRYRMGVVRLGDRVAQVAFSPTDTRDMAGAAFDRLVVRAGERLAELGRD